MSPDLIRDSLELHRWLTCAEKDEDQIVPVEDQPLIKSAIVTRIRDHIKALDAPLFIAEREDFMLYLTAWTQCDGNGPIKSYLESELKAHPKRVLEFVRCFLGNAHVVETGIPFQPPVTRHSYDYLQSVVDPELLASIISTVFGVGPEVSAADFKFDRDPDRALAQQYIRMNNFVRKQSSVSPKNDDPGSPPPQQPPQ